MHSPLPGQSSHANSSEITSPGCLCFKARLPNGWLPRGSIELDRMTRFTDEIERALGLPNNGRGQAIAAPNRYVFETVRVTGPWNNPRRAKLQTGSVDEHRLAIDYDDIRANPGNADLRPGGTCAKACKNDQSGLVLQHENYLILFQL